MSLPTGNYAPAGITYEDQNGRSSRFECWGTVLTAANFDAKRALWATLITKTDALTLGTKIKSEYGIETLYLSDLPGDNAAQRGKKLLIRYQDNTTGKKRTLTIPTADLSAVSFLAGAGDNASLSTPAAVTEWITAFQAFAVDPDTGNPVVVQGIEYVGRNAN